MPVFRLAYESVLILNIIDNNLLAYRVEKNFPVLSLFMNFVIFIVKKYKKHYKHD